MRLTIVGCGDAFGSGGRFHTCFHLETAGPRVCVDFGASALVALKTYKINPNDIDGVVLTHLHGDHFAGVPFLLLDAHFLALRSRPLVIAGPPGTRRRLMDLLEVCFPGSTQIGWRFPLHITEIEPGRPHELLNLRIESTEVDHPSGAPSTAVRLNDGRRVLAYSGDTQWTEALCAVGRDADLFIIECYNYRSKIPFHLSWRELKAQLGEFKARRLMITHMNPTMLARVSEAEAMGVLVASDGLRLDI